MFVPFRGCAPVGKTGLGLRSNHTICKQELTGEVAVVRALYTFIELASYLKVKSYKMNSPAHLGKAGEDRLGEFGASVQSLLVLCVWCFVILVVALLVSVCCSVASLTVEFGASCLDLQVLRCDFSEGPRDWGVG